MIPSRPPQVKETVAARIEEAAALLAVLQDPSLSSGGSQARRNATEHALLTVAAELRDALFVYASRAARDAALVSLSLSFDELRVRRDFSPKFFLKNLNCSMTCLRHLGNYVSAFRISLKQNVVRVIIKNSTPQAPALLKASAAPTFRAVTLACATEKSRDGASNGEASALEE